MSKIDVLATQLVADFKAAAGGCQEEDLLARLFGEVVGALALDRSAHLIFQNAYEQSISRKIKRSIADLMEFHEVLAGGGHDEDNWRFFSAAGKACLLADYSVAPTDDHDEQYTPSIRSRMKARSRSALFSNVSNSKAFAVSGSDGNFVVVMTSSGGEWSVHIREYWESIDQLYRSGSFNADRNVHSIEWAVEFASKVVSYSDDVPGVYSPRRPSLVTFSKGNFKVGSEEAGIGLRYGDSRDAGFVLSYRAEAKNYEDSTDVYQQRYATTAARALKVIDGFMETLKLNF